MSEDKEDIARIQAQIGVSINLARQVVASWLPAQDASKPVASSQAAISDAALMKPRLSTRAGLGHTTGTAAGEASTMLSLEEHQIKRRLAQQTKARQAAKLEGANGSRQGQHGKHGRAEEADDSDEEFGMRKGGGASVGKKKHSSYDAFTHRKQKKQKQKHHRPLQ